MRSQFVVIRQKSLPIGAGASGRSKRNPESLLVLTSPLDRGLGRRLAAHHYPTHLSFRLRYRGSCQEFANKELNKLTAFSNCQIKRTQGGAVVPTPLLKELEKHLLPGVIICPIANAGAIYQLQKQGIISYEIVIAGDDREREYRFLPGLPGILTMAMKSKQLRLPDDELLIV